MTDNRRSVVVLGANTLVIDIIETILGRQNNENGGPPITVLVDPGTSDWERGADLGSRIVAVLVDPCDIDVVAAVQRGADAVVEVDEVGIRLAEAVASVRAGNTFLSPTHTRAVLDALRQVRPADNRPQLSSREGEILRSIVAGRSVKQTAAHLGIAPKTVENLQGRMFRKVGARNRAHAVSRAHELGLIDHEPHGVDAPLVGGGVLP